VSEPKPASPVEVTNTDPVPVSVVDHQDHDSPAQTDARKTAAEARVSADMLRTDDQRRISGIWERTQQIIALSVVETALFVAAAKSIEAAFSGQASTEAGVAFVFLASVANLVIGFYFGRTNHQKVGGDPGETLGR
jgi:hypothetical protein